MRRRRSTSTHPAPCAATSRALRGAPRSSGSRRISTRCSPSRTRLTIRQDGSTVDLVSAVESRRVVAGSRTQVSMPEGELADSKVGWDGQWFVIDRDVRNGPHVVEKFRLMPKTGQLEYQMKWSGDSELRGMKIHRVFDRSTPGRRRRPIRRRARAGERRRKKEKSFRQDEQDEQDVRRRNDHLLLGNALISSILLIWFILSILSPDLRPRRRSNSPSRPSISRNSSKPYSPHSRPLPDCL